jgi:hypothetical protein
MMSRLRLTLLGLVALSLAACSGGTDSKEGQLSSLIEIRKAAQANRAVRNAPKPEVNRAVIEQINAPLLEVGLKSRDVTGYYLEFSVRPPVRIWRALDGGQIVIREGLVTGTRGIGYDLASSSYAETLAALHHGSGTARRSYHLRTDLGTQANIELSCTFQTLGHETIEIYDLTYATRRVQETCRNEVGEEIVNDYWIERQSGIIRQSNQWVSPDLGHFNLRYLKHSMN